MYIPKTEKLDYMCLAQKYNKPKGHRMMISAYPHCFKVVFEPWETLELKQTKKLKMY